MDPRIQIAISIMKKGLDRSASFHEAAALVNLSSSRLRHKFSLELGVSPAQYLRMLRMEKTKELLETTWLTVLQIALEVGLQDRSHFEREFKKYYSLTPSQYRASRRYIVIETNSDDFTT